MSSIKLALLDGGEPLPGVLQGAIERIGLPEVTLRVKDLDPADYFLRSLTASHLKAAEEVLTNWIEDPLGHDALPAAGHRVVHGGPRYSDPCLAGNGGQTMPPA